MFFMATNSIVELNKNEVMKHLQKKSTMKGIKLFTISIIAFVSLVTFFSAKSDKVAIEDTSGSLLWKITSNKQNAPSYLYGTIHLLPEKDFFIGQDVIDAFKEVKSLTMEADIDIPIKEQIKLAKQLLLPNGKTLQDYMEPEDYSHLYSYLTDSLKIKDSKVKRYFMFKPFNLLGFVCMEYYDGIKMYEQEFSHMAKKQEINLNALEDLQTQMQMLEESGVDMEVPEGKDVYLIEEYEKLKNIYLQKDLEALTTYLQAELQAEEYHELEQKLITERNINWIPKLDSIVSAEPSFIAVGIGHLGGEQGLINLLKEKGYTVTPAN